MENAKVVGFSEKANKRKRTSIKAGIVAVCIAFLLLGLFLSFGKQDEKSILREVLMQDWWKFDEINDTICLLILDFSKNEINYVVSDFDKETVISTVAFEILSENQFFIKDYNTVFTVEFSEDGKQMTVLPGLTSASDSEDWVVMGRPYGTEK